MAKLLLKFENRVLREVPLTKGAVTIGRLADNLLQVDNPAVSGHHARVYWETDHFVVEDNNSFNGTYVNDQRISKKVLSDGDNILIGKHILTFKAEPLAEVASASPVISRAPMPSLEATAMLDTKKARELMAQAATKSAAPPDHTPDDPLSFQAVAATPPPAKRRMGVLSVISGNTDQSRYVLTSKLTVIGKSDMASIKLKGWFAPKVAAAINHRDDKYFIADSGGSQKVKVNGEKISAQRELHEGDMIAVAKVQMTFGYIE